MKRLIPILMALTILIPSSAGSWGPVMMSGGVAASACAGTGDLGWTTDGASSSSNATDIHGYMNQWTAGANICISKGWAYLGRGAAGDTFKMILVADTGSNTPDYTSVLACSDTVTPGSAGIELREFTFASTYQVVSGTKYWVGYISSSNNSGTFHYTTDTPPLRYSLTVTTFNTCTLASTTSGTGRKISMWVSDD